MTVIFIIVIMVHLSNRLNTRLVYRVSSINIWHESKYYYYLSFTKFLEVISQHSIHVCILLPFIAYNYACDDVCR